MTLHFVNSDIMLCPISNNFSLNYFYFLHCSISKKKKKNSMNVIQFIELTEDISKLSNFAWQFEY